jgi:hypothetical protein
MNVAYPISERQTSRNSSRKSLKMVQVMKAYVDRRKRVGRDMMPIDEDEEDGKCECTICLRSQPKPASRDIFAESKKLFDLLNALPQIGSRVSKQAKSSRAKFKRRQIPRPNVTVIHELGVCEEYEVECEACIWNMKQTWRFGVLGEGNLPEYLDNMLNSKAPEEFWT